MPARPLRAVAPPDTVGARERLRQSLHGPRGSGEPNLGGALVARGLVDAGALAQVQLQKARLEWIARGRGPRAAAAGRARERAAADAARRHPGGGAARPLDAELLGRLRFLTRLCVQAVAAELGAGTALEAGHDLAALSESDSTLVRLVNRLITDAIDHRASDIHTRRRSRRGRGRRRELRVVVVPTARGLEDVVLRLLNSTEPMPLGEIGLSEPSLAGLRDLITKPYGLILICGPTGCGKTTTLHSVMHELNTDRRKIWTAEDPVEITQAGLRQVQLAIGLDPFMFSDSLLAVLAQRLVRRLCKACRQPEPMPAAQLETLVRLHLGSAIGASAASEVYRQALVGDWQRRHAGADGALRHWRRVGCPQCGGSGYHGRLGLHELLTVDEPLRGLIRRRAPASELQRYGLGEGRRTIRQDGLDKVLAGLTDLPEVLTATNQ